MLHDLMMIEQNPEPRPSSATAWHFATHTAIREHRPFSYWPSRQPGLLPHVPLPPAAHGLTLGGHTQ